MNPWLLLIIASVLLAAFSQMLLKKGATIRHESFIGDYLNFWVVSGYALLGVSLLVDIFAISKGVQVKEVSTLESLSYLFVPFLSLLFFGEKISRRKAASIALIIAGIVVFFI